LGGDGESYENWTKRAPAPHHGKIRRLLSFSRKYPNLDVVDPYYGGPQGFEENLDMIADAVQGLIREITSDSSVNLRKSV
jgi:low molecular weight protein-tyrosine phosphatase